ncbi:MAG: ABC transporter permease [Bacteroidales bacterium]|nr:ABC transporter permease [Bacteroidales bacterium]
MIELVKKDLKLFFGNKQDMLLTLVLPIIFITLFSFVFGKLGQPGKGNSGAIVHVVAGTSVMMLLFSVAGIGGSLIDEKQDGMLKKLLCSPIHPNEILFGKIIFANIISLIQLIIMFIFAWLAFGLDILHHLAPLLLMILSTAWACSSFGIVLASFARTRQQVQGLSTIVVLVMSAIGGSMIPIFLMPKILQDVAVISVNYWGIQGFYDIFLRLLPITDTDFLLRVLALLLIGTSLNFLAFQMFKRNIRRIT